MSIPYSEFREMRDEIEANLVEKASAATFQRTARWFGVIATIMGLGGWTYLHVKFQEQVDDLSRELREDMEMQSRELSIQLSEAQYQLAQIDTDRQDIQRVREDVEQARIQSVDALDSINVSLANIGEAEASVEKLQVQYAVDLANLLYTRDQLVGQVASIQRSLGQPAGTGGSLLVSGTKQTDAAPESAVSWGERKIILLRERPASLPTGEEAEEVTAEMEQAWAETQMAAWELAGLSARLRIVLAREGYEVDEWETKAGRPKADIEALFSAEAGTVTYPEGQPVLFSHPDFGGEGRPVSELIGALKEAGGLGPVEAVANSGFTPGDGYRGSLGDGLGGDPHFSVREVAILYLPLGA